MRRWGFQRKRWPRLWSPSSISSKRTSSKRTRSRSPVSEISWSGKRGRGEAATLRQESDIEISSRRILTFKPSQVLKAGLNRQGDISLFKGLSIEGLLTSAWAWSRLGRAEFGKPCDGERGNLPRLLKRQEYEIPSPPKGSIIGSER